MTDLYSIYMQVWKLGLLTLLLAATGSSQTGVVEGTVLDSTSGMGIAAVSVFFGMTDGASYETTTDASGSFLPQTSFSGAAVDYGWIYRCNTDGTFSLTDLRSGYYFAWALNVSPAKLPDLDVLRGLLSSSVSVRVEEGSTAIANLKMTHLPE